ncbi:MAG: trypsin-like peptidase domain-containing protein [Anaerolineae bacterium]|nr:trypsin-like peptidase domain-containing protein [Anaerolineae bacterium]
MSTSASPKTHSTCAAGRGFVYDAQGHIITNNHVIDQAAQIHVTFYNGQVARAELVGSDTYSDIAVIRVDMPAEALFPVTLGVSRELRVGQHVVAIGNPFGLAGTMTSGIISALGRTLPSATLVTGAPSGYSNPNIIQTDAEVNPGNSGGPLLNSRGEVIGVNTAIRTESGVFQGIAFAVPVDTVRRIVPQLIAQGFADYSWLGVETETGGPGSGGTGFTVAQLREPLGLPVDYGVMISRVVPGGPAAAAGIQGGNRDEFVRGVRVTAGGDIIIAINGETIRDWEDLVGYLVSQTSPGDIAILTVIRDDKTFEIAVTLGTRPQGN